MIKQAGVGLLLVLWAVGCGGDGDPVEGAWSVSSSSTGCGWTIVFDGGNWESQFECPLQGGGDGIEVERGKYTISGNQISNYTTESSCPGDTAEPETLQFEVRENTLVFQSAEGVVSLQRVQLPEFVGGAAFGCFADDLTFTQHPIQPVQP